jgi:hypothetical protein
LTALTNVIDNTLKNNHEVFIDSAVALSIDNTTDTIQHKSAFIRHLITHKINRNMFYSSFCKTTSIQSIHSIEGYTNMCVMTELPIIQIYYNTFKHGIINIQANHDNVVGDFYAQKQTKQDFKVTIKSLFEHIIKPLNINPDNALLVKPHDENVGMGMFKHATRGTLGMLTYDASTELNVQVMSSPTEMNANRD